MKKRCAIALYCSVLLMTGCQPSQQADQNPEAETIPPAATEVAPAPTESYPSLTSAIMEKLWNECDYIDFSFYYTNFSMNQNEQNSIRATLRHVASEVPQINPNCQPIGHLFYQTQGKVVLDADLFFSQGCTYFIFYENGKKAYANNMTPAGVQFYNDLFKRVEGGQ